MVFHFHPQGEKQKNGTNHKKDCDGKYRKPHATGKGFNNPEAESSGYGSQFFHHIIKAEVTGMIGG